MNKNQNTSANIILVVTVLAILLILIIALVIGKKAEPKASNEEDLLNINYDVSSNEVSLPQYDTTNPLVAMYVENYGSIVMELYPSVAPNTVNNFISLVKSGFYDNNTFHRLAPGFVLQGGDPEGTGNGGPDYTIKGEFAANGYSNSLKHEKGVISMARGSNSYDSAGSQFFIVLDTATYLDGNYAAFGKVIDGWKNIESIVANEKIANTDTGKLQRNLKIKKALIDLKGKSYPAVEKVTN